MLKKRNGSKRRTRLVYAHSTGAIEPWMQMNSIIFEVICIGKATQPALDSAPLAGTCPLQIEAVYGHKVRVHEPV